MKRPTEADESEEDGQKESSAAILESAQVKHKSNEDVRDSNLS